MDESKSSITLHVTELVSNKCLSNINIMLSKNYIQKHSVKVPD